MKPLGITIRPSAKRDQHQVIALPIDPTHAQMGTEPTAVEVGTEAQSFRVRWDAARLKYKMKPPTNLGKFYSDI